MLEGEKMKYWILKILRAFAIPAILIIVTLFFILKFIDVRNQEISGVVLGVMLGVILTFAADLSKRGLDDLKKQKLRKVSLKLLEEDAKGIYRTIWIYDRIMKNEKISKKFKGVIPPELTLKYWKNLKESSEFLMLGAEEPFDKIFEKMWNFEQINEQIALAKQGNQEASVFAQTFYRVTIDEQSHKKLLLFFKSEKEIEELDRKHIEATEQGHDRSL